MTIMIKVSYDHSEFAKLIENLIDGKLKPETCMELAYFIEDCWNDGIEMDRLEQIVDAVMEFSSARELIEYYYTDNPYDMIRKEDGDLTDKECEEKLMEKLQDEGMTILKTANGYATIE